MNFIKRITSGLAGSLVLTGLHQLLKNNYRKAPRMDLLGEEAILMGLDKMDIDAPPEEQLYDMTMAADIISNAFYYSLAGGKGNSTLKGTVLGIAAGAGALSLPSKMGLNEQHSNRTIQTQVLTVAIYTIGGFVAGKVMDKLKK